MYCTCLYVPANCTLCSLSCLGGFLYLRLLSRSVDSVGGGAEGLAAAAQPRLLIPVVLALGYNRWNLLFAESYGVHLQLLPMLVRFFRGR